MSFSLRCPSHPDAPLIDDHRAGDVICSACGLVVGDRVVDVGTEWRSFNNESNTKDPSRVGAPENPLLGGDLSTSIAVGPDRSGYDLASKQRKTGGSDRRLMVAYQTMREMSDRINLPSSIVDQANSLFKQISDTQSLRGRSTEAVAAACLYIGCRKEGVPRTFKEICAVSKASRKEIGRCFRLVMKSIEGNISVITSTDFMSRFCGNLSLPRYVEACAMHIARRAVELNLASSRSPISVAAAAIFMASQATPEDKRTAKEIGEIAGVAEVTIRQSYKLLLQRKHELFSPEFQYFSLIDNLPN